MTKKPEENKDKKLDKKAKQKAAVKSTVATKSDTTSPLRKDAKKKKKKFLPIILAALLAIGLYVVSQQATTSSGTTSSSSTTSTSKSSSVASSSSSSSKEEQSYKPSKEETDYLKNKFQNLSATNKDTIAYVYAPGTKLDEPVVQTTDNALYLSKTFEGGEDAYLGTVFMDTDNSKNFDDSLTWLFGHARGSQVADHRMFNDVNYYDDQTYFDQHPYVVVETPTRKYYYEAAFLIIVPETTAFYKTDFASKQEFKEQLTEVSKLAHTKNPNIKIDENDHYLVLSTCREYDETIRSNLYLRRIPDSEIPALLEKEGDKLQYKPTR